jgi:hypothetical protein
VTYRSNPVRQQVLELAAPLPPSVPSWKKAQFLRILDGKLPAGQKLATPAVVKCPD